MNLTAANVIAERRRLALEDPAGEAEAVSPLLRDDAVRWRAGLADSLARAGYTGPGADVAFLADAGVPLPPTIGERTALDLRHGPPPPQLAGAFLTPEGPTVIYGKGGTGKGVFACYLIAQLVRAGHVPMILDYEYHEREWGSRLRGLGLTADELLQVKYRAPFGPDWTARTGPLSIVADLVRDDCDANGVTVLIVDSYSPATSNGDTMGGEAAAREYFTSLSRIGRPSLTIAHVAGNAEKFPDKPFGSVFIHNFARETWAVAKTTDDDDFDPEDNDYQPHVVALELRHRKGNVGPKLRPQFATFSFLADGTIEVDTTAAGRAVWEQAAAVLDDGPMTIAEIARAIQEDTAETIATDTLIKALQRRPQTFAMSATRPRKWSLRGE